MGYIANYGYTDGSGTYLISINSGRCNGCGECVGACPQRIFEVALDDYDDMVARVKDEFRKDLKYVCAACKSMSATKKPPCTTACKAGAIAHSW